MSNLSLVSSYDFGAVALAKEALKHRLFVPGWDLNPSLHYIIDNDNSMEYGVALLRFRGKPIAVAIYKVSFNRVVYTFVRKSFRGLGYGTRVTEHLIENNPTTKIPLGNDTGLDGCEMFFRSLGLDILEENECDYDSDY